MKAFARFSPHNYRSRFGSAATPRMLRRKTRPPSRRFSLRSLCSIAGTTWPQADGRMARGLSEDKYDFKPTRATQLRDNCSMQRATTFSRTRTGKKAPAGEDPKREDYKSKAAIVAFVKQSFADGAAAIKAKETRLSDLLVDPFANQQCECRHGMGAARTFRRTLWSLVGYYRTAGWCTRVQAEEIVLLVVSFDKTGLTTQ